MILKITLFSLLLASALAFGSEAAKVVDAELAQTAKFQNKDSGKPSLRDLFSCAEGISSSAFGAGEFVNWRASDLDRG